MTTHYTSTEQGGIRFTSQRRPGDVRIPNYVYDLWMPLLGIDAIGVYAVYCRLEREGTVKAMNQQRIAKEMRIGAGRLAKVNDLLQRYGFIKVRKPQGQEKLMHWTTEIAVLDPPQTISADTIEELQHPKGYEPLCPWLTAPPGTPNSNAGDTNQSHDKTPNSNAIVAPLGVAPSVVEKDAADGDSLADEFKTPAPRQRHTAEAFKARHNALDVMSGKETVQARAQVEHPDFTDATKDGDAWGVATDAFGSMVDKDFTLPTRIKLARIFESVGAATRATAPEVADAIGRFKESYPWWNDDWPSDGFCNRLGMLLTPNAEAVIADLDSAGYRTDAPGAI